MGSKEESAERGFKVIDRRGGRAEADAGGSTRPEAPPRPAGEGEGGPLPAIDFSTFVLSLGTSALYHMGLVADPESGKPAPEANLPLARHSIDTLEMLQEKTRGNLDEEEARLLESLLYELRMHFVKAGK